MNLKLEDGDILITQRKLTEEEAESCKHPTVRAMHTALPVTSSVVVIVSAALPVISSMAYWLGMT